MKNKELYAMLQELNASDPKFKLTSAGQLHINTSDDLDRPDFQTHIGRVSFRECMPPGTPDSWQVELKDPRTPDGRWSGYSVHDNYHSALVTLWSYRHLLSGATTPSDSIVLITRLSGLATSQ